MVSWWIGIVAWLRRVLVRNDIRVWWRLCRCPIYILIWSINQLKLFIISVKDSWYPFAQPPSHTPIKPIYHFRQRHDSWYPKPNPHTPQIKLFIISVKDMTHGTPSPTPSNPRWNYLFQSTRCLMVPRMLLPSECFKKRFNLWWFVNVMSVHWNSQQLQA